MQTLEKKVQVKLSKGEYLRLRFLAKLKRIIAEGENKAKERIALFIGLTGNPVKLDTSKSAYRIEYGENLFPCEMVYDGLTVATLTVCDNPLAVDMALLKDEYPEAYLACVKANGKHVRLSVKK